MDQQFTIFVNEEITDDAIDLLHGSINSVSCVRQNGKNFIECDVEAETLDDAVKQVVAVIKQAGLSVIRLEVLAENSGVLS